MDIMALDGIDLSSLSEEQLSVLQSRIRAESIGREIKKARTEGKCFEKLEDIPPVAGHKHTFEKRDSHTGVEAYRCLEKGCFEGAYRCELCGYVPGEPSERPYDDMGPLCGSKGIDYLCKVCGTHLGTEVHMQS